MALQNLPNRDKMLRLSSSPMKENDLTICIAAVCDEGKNIVVAADRMFTVGHPLNVEFEPPLSKIETMSTACLALGAGNSLFVSEIFSRARAGYQSNPAITVPQVAIATKDSYSAYRDERLEEQIIRQNLGPDFTAFRSRGGTLPQYLQPQAGIYQQLFVQTNQFNLGVDILVTGIDGSGSHLYFIGHPGTIVSFDKIGYNAIGSGATHAAIRFAIGLQHPRLTLAETLLSVYGAKKAAEVAPGVGQDTEMAVISAGSVWPVPSILIERFAGLHKKQEEKPKLDVEEIAKKYAELRKDA